MLGPTWLKVKFELKLSDQMEKKTTKMKWEWIGREIKDHVKFETYE